MATLDFSDLEVYRLAERLSESIWVVVWGWDRLAMDTVGKQVVRSADSIGANIAEGSGRGTFQDNRRFVRMARGSLYETRHWLRRAHTRNLLTPEQTSNIKQITTELGPRLNAYLKSIGPASDQVRPTSDKSQMTSDK